MGYRFRMYVDDKTKDAENERIAFAYLHWNGAMHSSVPLTIMVAKCIEIEFKNTIFSTNPIIRDRQLKDIVAQQLIKNTSARPSRRDMIKLGFDVSNIGKYSESDKGKTLLETIAESRKNGYEQKFYDCQSEVVLNKEELYIYQMDLEAVFHINIQEDYSITIDHDFGVFYKLDEDDYKNLQDCYCEECNAGTYCTDNFMHADNQEKLKQLPVINIEQPFVNMSIEKLNEIYDKTSNTIIPGSCLSEFLFFNVNGNIYRGY